MASVESAVSTDLSAVDMAAAKKLAAVTAAKPVTKAGSRSSRSRSRGASTSASEASTVSNASSAASAASSAAGAGEADPVERFFLWGCELSRSRDTHVLQFPTDADEDAEVHRLSLKSAALGLNAIEKERNVVEIRFLDAKGEEHRLALASLTLGAMDACKLDLAVTWTRGHDITLKLVKGSGPVAIVGNHVVETYDDADDDAYVPTDDESSADETGMDTDGDGVDADEVEDIVKDVVVEDGGA